MSSEVDAVIADEFRELRKEVEKQLKQLEGKDYGDEVAEIGIIPMVVNLTPELEAAGFHKEKIKYSKKNKDADIRLRINFNEFFNESYEGRKRLLLNNVLESVGALGEKVKKGFNSTALQQDIKQLFSME